MTPPALTPWKMHKSYPPSMNWWIVIAAFRLLNVDDWLLTMQRDLHLRFTGSSGQVDCRGHEAETSLSQEPGWTAWISPAFYSHSEQIYSTSTFTDTYTSYSVYTTTDISTLVYTPTYWNPIGHHKPATHCHVLSYSSLTCIIVLPPWGCSE